VNGFTVGYLYDGAQPIAELRGSAIDTVYHAGLAIDEVLARYAPSGNETLLTDALNSVIAQARDDQSVGNFYSYSPYGETTTLGTDDGNSLQYTGRENDRTGLYFYRARYYDPVLKRFISEDLMGLAAGLNFYAYVRGNPVTRRDPNGLVDFCDETGCYINQPDSCIYDPTTCNDYHDPGKEPCCDSNKLNECTRDAATDAPECVACGKCKLPKYLCPSCYTCGLSVIKTAACIADACPLVTTGTCKNDPACNGAN